MLSLTSGNCYQPKGHKLVMGVSIPLVQGSPGSLYRHLREAVDRVLAPNAFCIRIATIYQYWYQTIHSLEVNGGSTGVSPVPLRAYAAHCHVFYAVSACQDYNRIADAYCKSIIGTVVTTHVENGTWPRTRTSILPVGSYPGAIADRTRHGPRHQ